MLKKYLLTFYSFKRKEGIKLFMLNKILKLSKFQSQQNVFENGVNLKFHNTLTLFVHGSYFMGGTNVGVECKGCLLLYYEAS